MSLIPEILYHATYKPLLDSIERNGLGGRGSQPFWEDSMPGLVKLSSSSNVARNYAEESKSVREDWLDEIVILEVDASQLDQNKFRYRQDSLVIMAIPWSM